MTPITEPPSLSPIAPEDIEKRLAQVKSEAVRWLQGRRRQDGFSFCEHAFTASELNATTGGVELWTLLGLPLTADERGGWVRRLQSYQNPETGLVTDPTWQDRQINRNPSQLKDGDTFFTMTCAAALEALGACYDHPVAYLQDLSAERLVASPDWGIAAHHPFAIGDYGRLIRVNLALGISGAQDQWEALLRCTAEWQDPLTGLWPAGHERTPLTPAINRSFHVLRATWNLCDAPCLKPDAIIDSCLEASTDARFYGWEPGYACNDLDLAHILYTACCQSDHCREEVRQWALRQLPMILAVQKPDGGFSFRHTRSMEDHGGIRMSPGQAEGDTWGTLMYLGTVKMMAELAYPGIRAPWAYSRVHAVPTPDASLTMSENPQGTTTLPGEKISIGAGTTIEPGARLDATSGEITLGKNCLVLQGALLLPYDGFIRMGDDCSINPYCVIYGHGGLTIGNGVRIATHTVIIPANHRFDDPDIPIFRQGLSCKGVTIEDDVWIGCHVSILDGAHIGRGSVIAAGSVVRGRVEPYSVMGGVPAKLLKKRNAPGSNR